MPNNAHTTYVKFGLQTFTENNIEQLSCHLQEVKSWYPMSKVKGYTATITFGNSKQFPPIELHIDTEGDLSELIDCLTNLREDWIKANSLITEVSK